MFVVFILLGLFCILIALSLQENSSRFVELSNLFLVIGILSGIYGFFGMVTGEEYQLKNEDMDVSSLTNRSYTWNKVRRHFKFDYSNIHIFNADGSYKNLTQDAAIINIQMLKYDQDYSLAYIDWIESDVNFTLHHDIAELTEMDISMLKNNIFLTDKIGILPYIVRKQKGDDHFVWDTSYYNRLSKDIIEKNINRGGDEHHFILDFSI